jgi:hypothetical protein
MSKTKNEYVTYWDISKAVLGLLMEIIILQVFIPGYLDVSLIQNSTQVTRSVFLVYCVGGFALFFSGWVFFSFWIELPYLLIKKYWKRKDVDVK